MKKSIGKIGFHLAIAVLSLSLSIVAYSAASVSKTVQLSAGKAVTIDLSGPVADVLVANPAIAEVGTLRSNRLYVVGRAIGDTNVLAFDDQGNQLADVSVHVRIDEKSLSESMREFFPGENIEVKTVSTNLVLSGSVSTPSVANQVRDMATRFVPQGQTVVDLMRVEGEQQVMLQVKVIEAKRTVLREFGLYTDYRAAAAGSSGGAFDAVAGTGLSALAPFGSGTIALGGGSFGPLSVNLQALEEDGLINTLAEPNLTAISGETAGFLAGGEYPVPVGRDQDGNITLEFKQFGVSLNFTPTVLSADRISLQLSTEVSAKSDADSVTLINTIIPGLSVRRAETTVEMGSGGTIMIAGLIKSDTVDSLSGMPGFQDIPILGELFKSKSFSRNESELVILVTPYIVEPFAHAKAARAEPPALPPVLAPLPVNHVPEKDSDGLPGTGLPRKAEAQIPAVVPDLTEEGQALSSRFASNLRRIYGHKAPSLPGGGGFGYIVD